VPRSRADPEVHRRVAVLVAPPRPRPSQTPTRFVADAMLGSLARKLRVFGYDTSYCRGRDDSYVIGAARKEGRAIITADRLLASRAAKLGVAIFLVRGRSDGERLDEIATLAEKLGKALVAEESRCSLCNRPLIPVSKEKVGKALPPGVLARHRLFYHCTRCDRFYWRGAHWKRLRRLRVRISTQLEAASGKGNARTKN